MADAATKRTTVESVSPMLLALLAWSEDNDDKMATQRVDDFLAGWRACEAYLESQIEPLIERAVRTTGPRSMGIRRR